MEPPVGGSTPQLTPEDGPRVRRPVSTATQPNGQSATSPSRNRKQCHSVTTSEAMSDLQWPPGGSEHARAGQHEAGRPRRARRRSKASWPVASLSWRYTSGLSQRPAFLRRTMEVRQPSSSGPCCPFSLPLRFAGAGNRLPAPPHDLDGFPRAASSPPDCGAARGARPPWHAFLRSLSPGKARR